MILTLPLLMEETEAGICNYEVASSEVNIKLSLI